MNESKDGGAEALQLKAYELLLATHLEPDNPDARIRLEEWLRESPEHWRAFRALDEHLEQASLLLAHSRLASSSRH